MNETLVEYAEQVYTTLNLLFNVPMYKRIGRGICLDWSIDQATANCIVISSSPVSVASDMCGYLTIFELDKPDISGRSYGIWWNIEGPYTSIVDWFSTIGDLVKYTNERIGELR